jgi:hypothetical protein
MRLRLRWLAYATTLLLTGCGGGDTTDAQVSQVLALQAGTAAGTGSVTPPGSGPGPDVPPSTLTLTAGAYGLAGAAGDLGSLVIFPAPAADLLLLVPPSATAPPVVLSAATAAADHREYTFAAGTLRVSRDGAGYRARLRTSASTQEAELLPVAHSGPPAGRSWNARIDLAGARLYDGDAGGTLRLTWSHRDADVVTLAEERWLGQAVDPAGGVSRALRLPTDGAWLGAQLTALRSGVLAEAAAGAAWADTRQTYTVANGTPVITDTTTAERRVRWCWHAVAPLVASDPYRSWRIVWVLQDAAGLRSSGQSELYLTLGPPYADLTPP